MRGNSKLALRFDGFLAVISLACSSTSWAQPSHKGILPATPSTTRPATPSTTRPATPSTTRPATTEPVAIPAVNKKLSSLDVVAKIPVPGTPDWMGVSFDSLWAPMNGQMVRIDPKTSKVIAKIPIGSEGYRGVAFSDKFVWVLNCGSKNLMQIDPKTNTVIRTLPFDTSQGSEGSIAANSQGVWLVTVDPPKNESYLTRLDPNDGRVVTKIKVPENSNGVLADFGSVWVTNTSNSSVSRIDIKTNQITKTITTHENPRFLTSGGGSIWTLNQGDGTVTRIDPKSNETKTIAANAPGGGGDIAFGENAAWVATFGSPIIRLDPKTNAPVERYEDSSVSADSIRAGLGYVWMADKSGSIWQIKAK